MSTPDFEKLRAERDAAIERAVQEICDDNGWDRNEVTFHSCHHGCYCACPDGPCEHSFTDWRAFEDGNGGERVCEKCGLGAMAHDMRVAP